MPMDKDQFKEIFDYWMSCLKEAEKRFPQHQDTVAVALAVVSAVGCGLSDAKDNATSCFDVYKASYDSSKEGFRHAANWL